MTKDQMMEAYYSAQDKVGYAKHEQKNITDELIKFVIKSHAQELFEHKDNSLQAIENVLDGLVKRCIAYSEGR